MSFFPSSGDNGRGQRTFRLKKNILRELDRLAKVMRGSSNQLVDDFLEEIFVRKMLKNGVRTMTLSREGVLNLLQLTNNDDDSAVRRVGGDLGGSEPKQIYAVHDVKPSWDTLLTDLNKVYSKTYEWFEFTSHCHSDPITGKETYRLIFTHDAGSKWTAFLEGYITNMIKSLLKAEPKVITATDNLLELTA
jgi:hypothetical protein